MPYWERGIYVPRMSSSGSAEAQEHFLLVGNLSVDSSVCAPTLSIAKLLIFTPVCAWSGDIFRAAQNAVSPHVCGD